MSTVSSGNGLQRARLGGTMRFLTALCAVFFALAGPSVEAQEPVACLSANPGVWPAQSKPYFLLIADTSDSMSSVLATASSCGYGATRGAHVRCALANIVRAYSGPANFGLMSFARNQTNCGATCYSTCSYSDYPSNLTGPGCGPGTGAARRGGFIRVPMLQDAYWLTPPPADNTANVLSWMDNACTANVELFANGLTPINGALRDAERYFSTSGWTAQDNSVTYPTPFDAQDRACRSASVVLIIDGNESCDTLSDAVAAATALFSTGVTVGGKTFKIRTYVVNFLGATIVDADAIAAAGGTGNSFFVNNEVDLTTTLNTIVQGRLQAESGDNLDNNCNSCSDEGFPRYCNVQPLPLACCNWATPTQRNNCLVNHRSSISPAQPQGNLALLPCTTAAQATDPLLWLNINPGESCDNVDNNCNGQTDEGQAKCGSPLHCPQTEVCNGLDDDCDAQIDEGCPQTCNRSAEICDGCDNDCDGFTDNGVAALPCGLAPGPGTPANCPGLLTCKPPQAVSIGSCVAGGGYNACTYNPQAETCDNLDNDCNGIVDDSLFSVACVPSGTPPGLRYGGTSQCVMGQTACQFGMTICQGFVGPTAEVTDGVDNDCDGTAEPYPPDRIFGNGFEP